MRPGSGTFGARRDRHEPARAGRMDLLADIAAMVAFLFSDDGSYFNGQSLLVDGGANFT
ncbi:SDR family oxidoreductase [Microbispora rosea]|nr:SDR family oxidoreductase [Microbispora rosea]